MIQKETFIAIIDNSGARNVKCIDVSPGFQRDYAYSGDTVVSVVQEMRVREGAVAKVKTGEVTYTVIVRTKFREYTKDGTSLSFGMNGGVLVNKQGKLIASRIIGPVSRSLKRAKHMKIASLSSGMI